MPKTPRARFQKTWLRLLLAGVALLGAAAFVLLGLPEFVEAQGSGGSFGGGSWGGGGGGGGGSWGGGGGGGSWGGGGSYGGGGGFSGGSSSGDAGGFAFMLFCLMLIFVVSAIAKASGNSRGPGMARAGASAWGGVDVTCIQIAVDWRARAELQKKLERMARSGKTKSTAGLAHLLRETAVHLLRVERAWLYTNVYNYHPMAPPQAQGAFTRLATEARTKYQNEVVRSDSGHLSTEAAKDYQARSEEGEGVVVITLVVAARQELLDIAQPQDAAQIRSALQSLSGLMGVVALEVIWSPAVEEDRMSTAELETIYPELKKIDEATIAGRIFCSYCAGPFAAELMKCPHCGAPVDRSGAAG